MEIIINNQKFNVDKADSFKKRFLGLMGKKTITKGLFFPKTRSIHTFFMKSNIDIIMIDKEMKVIYIKRNIPRNRIIINLKAKATIELPPNSINNLQVNDFIKIKTIPKV